jgi:DNA polymerase-3 subunit delta
LFQDKTEYVITNASFLNCKNDKDNNLINILNKIDGKIYCFVSDDKINTKLPNAQYHKVAKFNNLSKQKLITNLLSEYDVKFDDVLTRNYFESLIDNEPFLIKSELEKLLLSARDKIITKEQIEKITSATVNTNFFKLTHLLLSKNKKELIKLYDNLISIKFQPIELLSMISSQLLSLKIYKLAKQDH